MMKVILLENVKKLGDVGSIVNVKPGFARNFLIPQKKAAMATKANVTYFEKRADELKKQAEERLSLAKARGEKLAALATVTISAQASEEGRLFGSIGPREIAMAVTEAGVELSKKEVTLPEGPLRDVGEHLVALPLDGDVTAKITVHVVAAES